jgi:hypothetical protein
MKIRGVMARKGDTPEYVNKMQQEVFKVLAEARSLEDLKQIEPKARGSTGGTWTSWTEPMLSSWPFTEE